MKILQLRFKNLNSLYGEWEIDFTQPEYEADGIFAITGSTGAGKSTILDALCLALYGVTPRLGNITSTNNEIMSRQTGECLVELTFSTVKGRYRVYWGQQRARKKADGKLQSARHELYQIVDGGDDLIISTKKSEITEKIQEVTGMSFEQFTRSILLAQGSFDAFLKADAATRSPILEQITGTEIYRLISQKVFEKHKEENQKLSDLKLKSNLINLLTDSEEEGLRAGLKEKSDTATEQVKILKTTTEKIHCLENIAKLEEQLLKLERENEVLQAQMEELKPERKRLDDDNKASELQVLHTQLMNLRKQQEDDKKDLDDNKKALPEKEKQLSELTDKLKLATETLASVKAKLKNELEQIKQVRAIDTQINILAENIKSSQADLLRGEKNLKELNSKKIESEKKLQDIEEKNKVYRSYLNDNKEDELLEKQLELIKTKAEIFDSLRNKKEQDETELAELQQKLKTQNDFLKKQEEIKEQLHKRFTELEKKITEIKEQYDKILSGKLLREYRTEKDNLLNERVYIKKIESLEQERKRLIDGKPCPLCGSIDHPFAEGNIPVLDETEKRIQAINEIINKAEHFETEVSNLEKKIPLIDKDIHKADREIAGAKILIEQHRKRIEQIAKESALTQQDSDTVKNALILLLKPFGIETFTVTELRNILNELEERLSKWIEYSDKYNTLVEKSFVIANEIKEYAIKLASISEANEEKRENLTQLNNGLDKLKKDRMKLYGDKNPDKEEEQLTQNIEKAEQEIEAIREEKAKISEFLNNIKTKIETLVASIEKRTKPLSETESKFKNEYSRLSFESEEAYCKALLPPDTKRSLSDKIKTMDERNKDISIRKADITRQTEIEKAKNTTDLPLSELKAEHSNIENMLKILREEIGAVNQRLSDNEEKKKESAILLNQLNLQQQEVSKWAKLNGLIGSQDGQKYSKFAQGITFEIMVANANKQLNKLNNRYILIRDMTEALELKVIDNFHGGEIRSTKNLSGGESFIVSLSLALGLSQMASKNVRIDSLFLDEGFGTLDEDALEMALETLAELQQDGKIIGIISHIPALKERISTQIIVLPLTGGRSELKGPGCKAIT